MGVTVREKYAGDGVWWVFIHRNGRTESRKIGDQATAEDVAKKLRALIALGQYGKEEKKESKMLFRNYAELWIEGNVKMFCKPGTYTRYRGILDNHLNKVFGSATLTEITRADIRGYLVKAHRAGAPRATVCLYRDVLSGIFGMAFDDEIIDVNPVTGVLRRLGLDQDRGMRGCTPFTQDETGVILDQARKDYRSDYYPFFLLAFRTGMRLGEMVGLRWSDIDWKSSRIKVQRSVSKKGVEGNPKNNKTRWADMTDALAAELRELSTARKKDALRLGMSDPEDRIFYRRGGYWSRNSITSIWQRILRRAGLRYEKIHAIRHSYASQLLSMGVSPVYVKEQLGHGSIGITIDIYGQWIPTGAAQVNVLDNPKRSPGAPSEDGRVAG